VQTSPYCDLKTFWKELTKYLKKMSQRLGEMLIQRTRSDLPAKFQAIGTAYGLQAIFVSLKDASSTPADEITDDDSGSNESDDEVDELDVSTLVEDDDDEEEEDEKEEEEEEEEEKKKTKNPVTKQKQKQLATDVAVMEYED